MRARNPTQFKDDILTSSSLSLFSSSCLRFSSSALRFSSSILCLSSSSSLNLRSSSSWAFLSSSAIPIKTMLVRFSILMATYVSLPRAASSTSFLFPWAAFLLNLASDFLSQIITNQIIVVPSIF